MSLLSLSDLHNFGLRHAVFQHHFANSGDEINNKIKRLLELKPTACQGRRMFKKMPWALVDKQPGGRLSPRAGQII